MVSVRSLTYFFAGWTCYAVLAVSLWHFIWFVSSQEDPARGDDLSSSVLSRLLQDCFLMVTFPLLHSLMATNSFKKLIPLHRSLYVLSTAGSLQLLTYFWCSVPEFVVWKLQLFSSSWFLSFVHVFCWITVYGTCLLMDLSELVGLKKIYYENFDYGDPLDYKSKELRCVYSHMRHPSFSCFCILFFFRPVMTIDRFLFAVSFLVYMIRFFNVDRNDFVYQKTQCKLKWNELRKLL